MNCPFKNHHIQIAEANIQSTISARNLGIFLDKNMSMADQVKKICQSAYFQIRNISLIRKILSDDTACILVHALVTSQLDNGNALLLWNFKFSSRKMSMNIKCSRSCTFKNSQI